jgi:hypothetical protein
MTVQVMDVHPDMVEMITNRKLFKGMLIESQTYGGDAWAEVRVHVDLAELNNGLCGHLDTRKCWGLTKVEHWIDELQYFLGETTTKPKDPPWYAA